MQTTPPASATATTPGLASHPLGDRLRGAMLRTVTEYRLIEPGDRILVAISGGKDSYTMLDLLGQARRRAPIRFDLLAFHLDQGQPGYDGEPLRAWLERSEIPFEIASRDTYTTVVAETEEGAAFCRVCSRLRRAELYQAADRHGCNKVSLGHHRDDALETLLLNLFYAGRLQAMPAVYRTNHGTLQVIRPLIECGEAEIAAHAAEARYPILPCRLCGTQENLKRDRVAGLLADLEREIPDLRAVMLAALKNVRASHLLDAELADAWESQADRFPPRR